MATVGRSGVGTNQEDVRRHNLGTALGHVHRAGRISRAELTARMGLNRSTIAGLVAELESLGLADQTKPTGTRIAAGRPSVDVRPRPGAYVLAVDLRVDGLTVARVGLGGVMHSRATGPVPPDHDPEAIASSVVDLMRLVVRDVEPGAALVGVGVGVPGIIRAEDGLVRLAPNLGWHDVPFAEILAELIDSVGMPVLRNDADLGALAEHLRGAGVGVDDLVYLSGEVGVGAGIIVARTQAGGRRRLCRRDRPHAVPHRRQAVPLRCARMLGDRDRRPGDRPGRRLPAGADRRAGGVPRGRARGDARAARRRPAPRPRARECGQPAQPAGRRAGRLPALAVPARARGRPERARGACARRSPRAGPGDAAGPRP